MTLTKRQLNVLAVAANRLHNAAHGAPHSNTIGDLKAACAEAEQMIMHALGKAPYPGDAIPVATLANNLNEDGNPRWPDSWCAGYPYTRVRKKPA